MAVAGVTGCTSGAVLSYWLRPKFRIVDPLICAGGIGLGYVMILLVVRVAYKSFWTACVLAFFGQLLICFEASITIDLQLVKYIC